MFFQSTIGSNKTKLDPNTREPASYNSARTSINFNTRKQLNRIAPVIYTVGEKM